MWTSTLLSIFKCTAHFTTLNTQHNNYNFGTQATYPTHLTATADQELKDGGHGDSLPSSLVMTKYSEVQNNKSMCWVHCAGLSLSHTHTYKESPAVFLRCMYTQTVLMHTWQSIRATGRSMTLYHSEPTVVRTVDEPKQVAEEECSHHLHDVLKWNTTPREARTLTQARRRCC